MKKYVRISAIVMLLLCLTSCVTIRVSSDYDETINFNQYKTFAFYKTGIDKAEINDLDKRRILRAIDNEMQLKGFSKSENPDVLVSLFTKSNEVVNVNRNNFGWGFGWGFYGASFGTTVSKSTKGILYIDILDAKTKTLIWQGKGSGYISQNKDKKQEQINEFVKEIISVYPPGTEHN